MLSPREFVRRYNIRSLACCWSGGRSSLAMTHYVMSELEDVEIDKYVVFVDTGVMLPDAVPFVKRVAERYGWNLKILRPKVDFWAYAERYGTPSVRKRWCCKYLKLFPIFEFVRTLPPQRAELLGFRADEVERRLERPVVWYRRETKGWVYCPIRTWTKKDVIDYIERNGLPDPPWYGIGLGESCLCGAYSSRKKLMVVRARYPELFRRFVELERVRLKRWGSTAFYDRKPLSAEWLSRQKTLSDFEEKEKSGDG